MITGACVNHADSGTVPDDVTIGFKTSSPAGALAGGDTIQVYFNIPLLDASSNPVVILNSGFSQCTATTESIGPSSDELTITLVGAWCLVVPGATVSFTITNHLKELGDAGYVRLAVKTSADTGIGNKVECFHISDSSVSLFHATPAPASPISGSTLQSLSIGFTTSSDGALVTSGGTATITVWSVPAAFLPSRTVTVDLAHGILGCICQTGCATTDNVGTLTVTLSAASITACVGSSTQVVLDVHDQFTVAGDAGPVHFYAKTSVDTEPLAAQSGYSIVDNSVAALSVTPRTAAAGESPVPCVVSFTTSGSGNLGAGDQLTLRSTQDVFVADSALPEVVCATPASFSSRCTASAIVVDSRNILITLADKSTSTDPCAIGNNEVAAIVMHGQMATNVEIGAALPIQFNMKTTRDTSWLGSSALAEYVVDDAPTGLTATPLKDDGSVATAAGDQPTKYEISFTPSARGGLGSGDTIKFAATYPFMGAAARAGAAVAVTDLAGFVDCQAAALSGATSSDGNSIVVTLDDAASHCLLAPGDQGSLSLAGNLATNSDASATVLSLSTSADTAACIVDGQIFTTSLGFPGAYDPAADYTNLINFVIITVAQASQVPPEDVLVLSVESAAPRRARGRRRLQAGIAVDVKIHYPVELYDEEPAPSSAALSAGIMGAFQNSDDATVFGIPSVEEPEHTGLQIFDSPISSFTASTAPPASSEDTPAALTIGFETSTTGTLTGGNTDTGVLADVITLVADQAIFVSGASTVAISSLTGFGSTCTLEAVTDETGHKLTATLGGTDCELAASTAATFTIYQRASSPRRRRAHPFQHQDLGGHRMAVFCTWLPDLRRRHLIVRLQHRHLRGPAKT